MIYIEYDFGNFEEKISKDLREKIELVCNKTLDIENIKGDFEVSISFVNDEEIQVINNDFRNKNCATDVLSFPMIEDFDNLFDFMPNLLGDIVISYPTAVKQSLDYNHSLEREILFLVCHSMLHLIGYDHILDDERIDMENKQDEILNSLGIFRE